MIEHITLDLIDHADQRYNSVGDWFLNEHDPTHLIVKVTRLPDLALAFAQWAVGIHELVEALAALAAGVTVAEVDVFDKQFEIDHSHDDLEPGDDPRCPVFQQHQLALEVERMFIKALGVEWEQYETEMDKPWLKRRRAEARRHARQSTK